MKTWSLCIGQRGCPADKLKYHNSTQNMSKYKMVTRRVIYLMKELFVVLLVLVFRIPIIYLTAIYVRVFIHLLQFIVYSLFWARFLLSLCVEKLMKSPDIFFINFLFILAFSYVTKNANFYYFFSFQFLLWFNFWQFVIRDAPEN
jgi:hypothetical protein